MKKLLTIKIAAIVIALIGLFVIIISVISAVTGVAFAYETIYRQASEIRGSSIVVNNQLYAQRYRNILDKYVVDKGYVSLERLIFYLQRTNNVLDITALSDEEWEKAYLANLNTERKQMIPIKTLCKDFIKNQTLPEYTITSDLNENGIMIEALNLCVVDNEDITISEKYTEVYNYLTFVFPLQTNFVTTSIVFENRNVNLNVSEEEQNRINYHSGWDFSVPIGTNFYSICSGTIKSIVNTQFNDLPYNESNNGTGNYVEVNCNNGLIATYAHIKANSTPAFLKPGVVIREGELLGLTSTTGLSTGPHLHLGLRDNKGNNLDALEYINFDYKR